jgi:hypothetical protein
MKKDYSKRLENLRNRRYDGLLQKAILTESFAKTKLGDSSKYVLESMRQIDPEYTKNTFKASENIQGNLKDGLQKEKIEVTFRHQGSIETNTHIELHSDIDILTITEKFFSLEPPQVPTFPYEGDPLKDLLDLRNKSFTILNGIYDQIDNSNSKSIKVFPTNPKRKVDVVFSNWYNSNDYNRLKNEVYRGVRIYDKDAHTRKLDFPFLNAAAINNKDLQVQGNLKKLIRLLKTVKADAEYEINLSSFEISSCLYNIPNQDLYLLEEFQLRLLPIASQQLNNLITDDNYRQNLLSPNGKETVFKNSENKVLELKKLKREIDELVEDLKEELLKSKLLFEERIVY